MKRRNLKPQFEGVEPRELPAQGMALHPMVHRAALPRQWQPRALSGTAFGAYLDTGPGNVIIDTSRPIIKSSSLQSVHGILSRDIANNKVTGWLIVQQSGGRQIKLDVFGNAGNTTFLGKMVNLKFTGNGEFAQSVRPGNIRLMLNTPIRGRLSLTFA